MKSPKKLKKKAMTGRTKEMLEKTVEGHLKNGGKVNKIMLESVDLDSKRKNEIKVTACLWLKF